ncbi:hypothetical protein PybrP1_003866 [[Pythium] brassicae (nom. inval.)]|nr:hypothetical protein PybrP1_003866 [[Pythium] brassicae (nom. inval.)]
MSQPTKLSLKISRRMLKWRHYDFHCLLDTNLKQAGGVLEMYREAYTTKTCTRCGNLHPTTNTIWSQAAPTVDVQPRSLGASQTEIQYGSISQTRRVRNKEGPQPALSIHAFAAKTLFL